jgi:hypothetical protein
MGKKAFLLLLLLGVFGFSSLLFGNSGSEAPDVEIVAPASESTFSEDILNVAVWFSSWKPQGNKGSGPVHTVQLLVNGQVVATHKNLSHKESDGVNIEVDLSEFPEGPVTLQAVALQGSGNEKRKGSSAPITIHLQEIVVDESSTLETTAAQGTTTTTHLSVRLIKPSDIDSGDGQEGTVGRCLPKPLIVKVIDTKTKLGVEGLLINFEGDAIFAEDKNLINVTNRDGLAGIRVILPLEPGRKTILAKLAKNPKKKARFTATGHLPTITVISGTTQPAPSAGVGLSPFFIHHQISGYLTGSALVNPFGIQITDHEGKAIPDVKVVFTRTGPLIDTQFPEKGPANVAVPEQVLTDATGKAFTGLVMDQAGTHTVSVLVPEFPGVTNATFDFTGGSCKDLKDLALNPDLVDPTKNPTFFTSTLTLDLIHAIIAPTMALIDVKDESAEVKRGGNGQIGAKGQLLGVPLTIKTRNLYGEDPDLAKYNRLLIEWYNAYLRSIGVNTEEKTRFEVLGFEIFSRVFGSFTVYHGNATFGDGVTPTAAALATSSSSEPKKTTKAKNVKTVEMRMLSANRTQSTTSQTQVQAQSTTEHRVYLPDNTTSGKAQAKLIPLENPVNPIAIRAMFEWDFLGVVISFKDLDPNDNFDITKLPFSSTSNWFSSGFVWFILHESYFMIGPPEVRFVRKDETGKFVPLELILYGDWRTPNIDTEYYIELKAPVGLESKTVKLVTKDPCREPLDLAFNLNPIAKVSQDINLEKAPEQTVPERYNLLRSPRIISTMQSSVIRTVVPEINRDPPDEGSGSIESSTSSTPSIPSGLENEAIQYGVEYGFTNVVVSWSPELEVARLPGLSPLQFLIPTFDLKLPVLNPLWLMHPAALYLKNEDIPLQLIVRYSGQGLPPETVTVFVHTPTKPGGLPLIMTRFGMLVAVPVGVLFDHWIYRGKLTASEVINQGLIAPPKDGIAEFALLDAVTYYRLRKQSNFNDSEAFRDRCLERGFQPKGIARSDSQDIFNTIFILGPDADMPAGSRVIAAGGFEALLVSFGTFAASHRIQNQADMFYFSGHGYHSAKQFGVAWGIVTTKDIANINAWQDEAPIIILAGCSLVDINDYNRYFVDSQGQDLAHRFVNPGKDLAESGASFILGYNAVAPGDSHDKKSDFTAQIVIRWFEYKDKIDNQQLQPGDPDNYPKAWIQANIDTERNYGDNDTTLQHSPYNCCGIDNTAIPEPLYWYFNKKVRDIFKVQKSRWNDPTYLGSK